jgi:DNA repair protein RadD
LALILRPYQERAARDVFAAWRSGHKRVCLVMGTGAGKTATGSFIAQQAKRQGLSTVWMTHTVDLLQQSAVRVPEAKVVSVQSGRLPPADVLVLDECHHFVADEWKRAVDAYPEALVVGLTATPERADGRPLGDMFSHLVVGASYTELLESGVLVPCRVLRPETELDRGVAKDPVEAYMAHGEGRTGFVYVRTIQLADKVAAEFRAKGIRAEVVSAETPPGQRKLLVDRMRDGDIRLLVNVYALTEGVDVPHASIAILARNFGHVSQFLQTAGRVLRAHPGKRDALVIDLPGVSHRHGTPLEDREYGLDGQGIRRKAGAALRVCMKCGMTWGSDGPCPRCGFSNPGQAVKPPRVYNAELVEVGRTIPTWVKRAEYDRLKDVARSKKLGDGFVKAEFQRKYGEAPSWLRTEADAESKKAELAKFVEQAKRKGYKPGYASQRYKALYGAFPPKGWT